MAFRRASADAGVDSTTMSIDVVVHDDAEAVAIVQTGERFLDRLLGERELGARHRARPVEHEGEVDRRALAPLGRGRRGQLDKHEPMAAVCWDGRGAGRRGRSGGSWKVLLE